MVVGCGISKEEAIENIKNAVSSYVDSMEEGMRLERPISLKLLHEFLDEQEEERVGMNEEVSAMKVLTYG
jgi:predicted RNase H-like HicB family nuclease